MRRLLSAFVYFFAVVGMAATAYFGFDHWLKATGRANVPETPKRAVATPAATQMDPDLASIVQNYRRPDQPTTSSGSATTVASVAGGARNIHSAASVTGIVREWPTGKRQVALTFDDGPHPEWTPKLLELLKQKNVRATFFLIGPNLEHNPDIGHAILAAGCEVGNHTMKHINLNAAKEDAIRTEVVGTTDRIRDILGMETTLMRPPFGNANKRAQDVIQSLNLKIINWSIDTNDWKPGTSEQSMKDNIMKNLRDGSIILMHDRSAKTYNTTAFVIDEIRKQGYTFVTVSELLGLPAPKRLEASPATTVASAPPAASIPAVASAAAQPVATAVVSTPAPAAPVSPSPAASVAPVSPVQPAAQTAPAAAPQPSIQPASAGNPLLELPTDVVTPLPPRRTR